MAMPMQSHRKVTVQKKERATRLSIALLTAACDWAEGATSVMFMVIASTCDLRIEPTSDHKRF
jgi:hypothetical protein